MARTRSTKPTKADLDAQKQQLVLEIARDRQKARDLFKRAGKSLDTLVELCEVGEEITLDDGRTFVIVDNFAKGNTAFKPVAMNLYDLEQIEEGAW